MTENGGYIVIGRGGNAMMLAHYDDTPRGGVLLFGRHGHLFASRGTAQRAVERTVRYARERGLTWERGDYSIQRVREAGGGNRE